MALVRNIIMGIALIGILLYLFTIIDTDLKTYYNYTDDTGENASSFIDSNLSIEISQSTAEISKSITTLSTAVITGDLVGALMAVASGTVNTLISYITLPHSFAIMVAEDFGIPKVIVDMSIALLTLLFGFILLSSRLRNEI